MARDITENCVEFHKQTLVSCADVEPPVLNVFLQTERVVDVTDDCEYTLRRGQTALIKYASQDGVLFGQLEEVRMQEDQAAVLEATDFTSFALTQQDQLNLALNDTFINQARLLGFDSLHMAEVVYEWAPDTCA